MLRYFMLLFSLFSLLLSAEGKVLVFQEPGFPAIENQLIPPQVLADALSAWSPVMIGNSGLRGPRAFDGVELLVLPYGSAFPVDSWKNIQAYLEKGGCVLNLGGRPFTVPVFRAERGWEAGPLQYAYSSLLGLRHSYEVPNFPPAGFIWTDGLSSLRNPNIQARQVFALEPDWGTKYRGLGYILREDQRKGAAPVVCLDYVPISERAIMPTPGGRLVALTFDPSPGYFSGAEGQQLIRDMASFAMQGASLFWVENVRSSLSRDEIPQLVVHLRDYKILSSGQPRRGEVHIKVSGEGMMIKFMKFPYWGEPLLEKVLLPSHLNPGLYQVEATYESGGRVQESYLDGFWIRDPGWLKAGEPLVAGKTYFRQGDRPFLPWGVNYFSTDWVDNGFLGSSNPFIWERDFAEMEKSGVNFVRTGVWNNYWDYIDRPTGEVHESVLDSLEAFLLSAARHHIQIHFTFWAFDPQTLLRRPFEQSLIRGEGKNPYTDPIARQAQKNYVQSVVRRFKDVPFLSWDLINEPSFSNPREIFRGNLPNADKTEIAAWNEWLKQRYDTVAALSRAWFIPAEDLGDWGSIPLPDPKDLQMTRAGNPGQVRAFDYNLFAQEMFQRWMTEMVEAIRSTGSRQMVTVGQDEGGVSNRVLNQFYGAGPIDFTVNHTWWQDDDLLWDSVVAKRPDKPNLVGETGLQPSIRMDGSSRWDEINGFGLLERKMSLGLAAGNSGALYWIWAGTGDSYRLHRSDGSESLRSDMMRGMGGFVKSITPYLGDAKSPEIALLLPQSLQLSAMNAYALEAQQKAIRALYHYARLDAYAVGEFQLTLLGNPKLIILPSPWCFNEAAWQTLLGKVKGGATLLLSGPFQQDGHFHPVTRLSELGVENFALPLAARENLVEWPGGHGWGSFGGEKCTFLERGVLKQGQSFAEAKVGQGRILYVPAPLELNDNLELLGKIYRYAAAQAGVQPSYETTCDDPGVLICPTRLEKGTLYVLTSESSQARQVSFKDHASGKEHLLELQPGRAKLLFAGNNGEVLAQY
jgi:hypothetical protein